MRPRLEVMRRAHALAKYAVPAEDYRRDFERARAKERVLERVFRSGLSAAIKHDTRTGTGAWGLSTGQADALASFAWEEGHGSGLDDVLGIAERLVDALNA